MSGKTGFPAEFVDKLPLPFPVAGAVRFPQQAQFHPLKFVSGIAKGLHIYEHTRARELIGYHGCNKSRPDSRQEDHCNDPLPLSQQARQLFPQTISTPLLCHRPQKRIGCGRYVFGRGTGGYVLSEL